MIRTKKAPLAALTASLLVAPAAANAADEIVLFNAAVAGACILTVGTPGTMAVDVATYQTLSSKNATGIAGTVTALTSGTGFEVSTTAPSAFLVAPATGNDNVSFASSYSLSGVTTILDVPGITPTVLGLGLTQVDVDLTATKSSGGFETGLYTASVTVTCE